MAREGLLRPAQLDQIVRQTPALPTFPAVVSNLLSLAPAGGADAISPDAASALAGAVARDLALSARVLALANRSSPGAATIPAACRVVGPEGILQAALTAGLLDPAPGVVPAGQMDHAGFWRHCLAVAHAARALAGPLALDPDLAYTAGLLHDLGKLFLADQLPKSYARALEAAHAAHSDLPDAERRLLGLDHAVAGRRLAHHWRLGDAVEQTAWLAHQPFEALPDSLAHAGLVKLVALADVLVRERALGFSGNYAFPRSAAELAAQLRLPTDLLEPAALLAVRSADADLAAMGLAAPAAPNAWGRTMIQVNRRLAALCDHLAARQRLTHSRADAFARLQPLLASLPADATVPDVLARLAAAVADAIGQPAGRVLAYRITAPAAVPDSYRRTPVACDGRPLAAVAYPPPADEAADPLIAWVCQAAAPVLALAIDRDAATELAEQLASASGRLVQTQDALAQDRATAGVGEMASGAAHELNNPLAVISGRAQLLRDRSDDPAVRKTCQIIVDQAQRISDLITSLMEIAAPAAPAPAALEVPALLAAAARAFYSSTHPKAAASTVDIHCGQDVPPVLADESQIVAVLVEAMTNAATAAHAAATIRLAARTDEADNAVVLSIQDDGPGMDAPTLARAFTPFFSAQPAGRRPGMGLPRARRYVEANGGRIWIQTKPGEGATVYVRLPQA